MNDDNKELISILQETAEKHRDVVAFGHVGHAPLIEELGAKSGEFSLLRRVVVVDVRVWEK